MISGTLTTTLKTAEGTVTVSSETIECDRSLVFERTIDVGVVDLEVVIEFLLADILAFGMGCATTRGEGGNKTTGITVKTNNLLSPDETFLLTPRIGIGWVSGGPLVVPFQNDMRRLYVTNTGTAKQDFFLRVLLKSLRVAV